MKHITGIHHVAIKACGQEKYQEVVRFYTDVLELDIASSTPTQTMIDTGAGLLEIFDNGTDEPGEGAWRHIALECDDVAGVVETVRAAGYPITMELKEIPGRGCIAFVTGAAGESIELYNM